MGDLINGTSVNEIGRNLSVVLGLDEYESDEALAAVELFAGYPEGLLQFSSVCCCIFMALGIPGNLITIVALSRCKKVRNATAIFIISLSCSDFLFCAFNLPLAASTFWHKSWAHGRLLCRMFPMARYALAAVSLFTVLAITINRYILIAWPTLYPKLYTKPKLAIMIIVIWTFSFSVLLATWFERWGRFSLDPTVGSCSIVPDVDNKSPKKVLFIAGFLIPGLGIILCYARIFWIVKKVTRRSRSTLRLRPKTDYLPRDSAGLVVVATNIDSNRANRISLPAKRPQQNVLNCLAIPELSSATAMETVSEEREKRITDGDRFLSRSSEALQKLRLALTPAPKPPKAQKRLPSKKDSRLRTMIVAILISFLFCHLPISVTKIFLEFKINPYVNMASYILLYMTTCINPIIYVAMSIEYRQAYKNLMTCQKTEQYWQEPTVVERLSSTKTIASIRRSLRKLRSGKTQSSNLQSPER